MRAPIACTFESCAFKPETFRGTAEPRVDERCLISSMPSMRLAADYWSPWQTLMTDPFVALIFTTELDLGDPKALRVR